MHLAPRDQIPNPSQSRRPVEPPLTDPVIAVRRTTSGFRLAGVRVRVSGGWWIAATLLGWMLGARLFPGLYPDASGGALVGMAVAGVAVLFVSVLLHEMAHAWIGHRYGVETAAVTLHLLGGVTEMRGAPRDPRADFGIAVAGPVASFALAAAFGAPVLLDLPLPGGVEGVLGFGAALNALLAMLNLLPVFPLDGGRMLRAALWHRSGDHAAATRDTIVLARVLGVVAIVVGLLAATLGQRGWGVSVLLVGLYLRLLARPPFRPNLGSRRADPSLES